jgi:hypothetical protein
VLLRRRSSTFRLFLAAVLVAACAVLLGGGSKPSFLAGKLGGRALSGEWTSASGARLALDERGLQLAGGAERIQLSLAGSSNSGWQFHEHGAVRDHPAGQETVLATADGAESFVTVDRHQGWRSWAWQLEGNLSARLLGGGRVGFVDPVRHRVTGVEIAPAAIYDSGGREVTPAGLGWGLERRGGDQFLTLGFDDAGLRLPYVIDPAVTYRFPTVSSSSSGTLLTLTKPAGTAPRDLLIAQVSARGSTAGVFVPPAGWTQVRAVMHGSSSLQQVIFYKVAGASEPASYSFTLGSSSSGLAGGISAFQGLKTSSPVDGHAASTSPVPSSTVTAPSLTTTSANALVLAFFSIASSSSFAPIAGMFELYDLGSQVTGQSGLTIAADVKSQASAGPTGSVSTQILPGAGLEDDGIGTQVAFRIDDVAPTVSLNDPGSPLGGVEFLTAAVVENDSAASAVLQRSPANADTWTPIGSDTAAPWGWSFNTIGLADGLYDLRVVVTDGADNVTTSAVVEDRLVDNTAPQTTLDAGPNGGWTAVPTATFEFSSASADTVGFECSIDTGDWMACTSPHTTGALADGVRDFQVRAVDLAGNPDQSPESRSWAIDTTAPTGTLADPGSPRSGVVALTANASDNANDYATVDSVNFQVSAANANTWTNLGTDETYDPVLVYAYDLTFETAALPDGLYDLRVVVTDSAGNVTTSDVVEDRRFDNVAPQTTIELAPSDPTSDATPSFGFSADEPVSGFECRLDSGAWTACTSPHAAGPLDDGDHVLEVRATDLAARVDPSAASHAWTTDSTAPAGLTIALVGGPVFSTGQVTLVLGSGSDAGVGLDEASRRLQRDTAPLNGGACGSFSGVWVPVSNPDASVAGGSCYRYRLSIADALGNRSAWVVSAEVQVQTPSPPAYLPDCSFAIGQPINADGSSVFKAGRGVIPVKLIPSCGNGSLAPTITVAYTGSGTGAINEGVNSVSSSDTGTTMRWDASAGQYIYNLDAKNKTAGSYKLSIKVAGNEVHSVGLDLK